MHVIFHCTDALRVHHVTCHLCFANPETFGAQRCYLPHVTFVQPLLAKSWTKLDISSKFVCRFSTKTAENNWKFSCTGKAWLMLVTWHQKSKWPKTGHIIFVLYTDDLITFVSSYTLQVVSGLVCGWNFFVVSCLSNQLLFIFYISFATGVTPW